jgi:MYXO-CTERM domain-containing protein
MQRRRFASPASLFASLLVFGVASHAVADETPCSMDADCSPEEYCEILDFACEDGEDCDPVMGGVCVEIREAPVPGDIDDDWDDEPSCETSSDCDAGSYCWEEMGECVPDWFVPCESASDCAEGLDCIDLAEWMDEDDWDDDWGDDEPPMPMPEPAFDKSRTLDEEMFYCLPTWLIPTPCESDAECGEGFVCVADEICSCSGGGEPGWEGEIPPDGGDFEKDEDGCVCEPTGDAWCELDETECSADGDCPSGWSCEELGGSDGTCWVDEDGNTGCDEPEDYSICVPPYFEEVYDAMPGGVGGDDLVSEGDPRQPDDGGGTGGGTGGSDAPSGDDDGLTGGSSGTDRPSSDGGCSAAPAGTGGGTAALSLLALFGLVRRRR